MGQLATVDVCELDWLKPEQWTSAGGPFDYVLAADCVYEEGLVEHLVSVVEAVASPRATGRGRKMRGGKEARKRRGEKVGGKAHAEMKYTPAWSPRAHSVDRKRVAQRKRTSSLFTGIWAWLGRQACLPFETGPKV